ncbi:MAG: hypothetical protein ACKO2P_20770 [Planctomycetota bacterium]
MDSETASQNPYATSMSRDVSSDTVAWHRDFQLIGRKLHCRTGLQLPEYCLVTGQSDGIMPFPLGIWAPGKSVRHYRLIGIGLLLLVPLVVALAIMIGGTAPRESSVMLIVTIISALLSVGLVLFLLGGRRGRLCEVQGVIDSRRLVWGRRLAVIPSWILILVLALRVGGFIGSNVVLLPLIFFSIGSQWFSGWFFQRGTQLRAVVDENGVFEISGFSKAFLKRLEEFRDAS